MIPKKNDATYKVIYWVGVFQGNKFNLTTANVMTPYDFFRSEKKKPEKKSCNTIFDQSWFYAVLNKYKN